MTLNKTKGFAVSLVSLGLLAAGMSAPIANAATVDSTVDAIDNCVWQLGSVPATWELTNTEKYIGDALTLASTASSNVVLGLAGSDEAAAAVAIDSLPTAECSFYGVILANGVTATLGAINVFDAKFGANYTDGTEEIGMDIPLTTSALNISGTADSECKTSYFEAELEPFPLAAPGDDVQTMSSKAELPNIVPAGVIDNADPSYKALCSQSLSLSIIIPERSSAPIGVGQNYFFEGPTITFSKTITN